ncbi:MAG: Asp-tRNA(Asn)/Glu-tRNA(Gln) amidotransferase subunit GatC [Christensenellales bacterium]
MRVPISVVEEIAVLTRLKLNENEKIQHQKYLEAILQTARGMRELDTSGILPTAHIQGINNVLREDDITPSMENEKLLANAPEHYNGCFIVPKVVE